MAKQEKEWQEENDYWIKNNYKYIKSLNNQQLKQWKRQQHDKLHQFHKDQKTAKKILNGLKHDFVSTSKVRGTVYRQFEKAQAKKKQQETFHIKN